MKPDEAEVDDDGELDRDRIVEEREREDFVQDNLVEPDDMEPWGPLDLGDGPNVQRAAGSITAKTNVAPASSFGCLRAMG